MEKTMSVAVLRKPGEIAIEERQVPVPGDREVLIRVRSVGVCGSDVHYFKHGRIGRYVVKAPLVLGHEVCGEVVGFGRGVVGIGHGDRVVVEPGLPCWRCAFCKEGRYNLCREMQFMATPPVDGAFAEYIAYPASMVFKVPDSLGTDAAALVEPLATSVYATKRARVQIGSRVAILGAGPIGLTAMQAARAAGATSVAVSDLTDFRLGVARSLGADLAVNVTGMSEAEVERCLGTDFDVVIEAAGSPSSMKVATRVARPGGRIAIVGLNPEEYLSFSLAQVCDKELEVLGVLRYAWAFQTALDLAARSIVNLDALVTHHFPLYRAGDALTFAHEAKSEAIKVMIHP